jgi:ribosomal protein L7Ae-like RNA K-turn-binding protein
LLPDISETEDVTTLIHHKLVEAFCWENDIALVKVDSFKKLGNMITTDQMNVNTINVGYFKTQLFINLSIKKRMLL